jgi:hypothetical protein
MREYDKEQHRRKVSQSLIGKIGVHARRWKGDSASYVAKHMWIHKHYGKASICEIDSTHKGKRFEWANISGAYLRDRSDYRQLCPSCHRRSDFGNKCRKGHEFTVENTWVRKEGWRVCRTCKRDYAKAH